MRAQVVFSTNLWHPTSHPQLWNPEPHFDFHCHLTKSKRPPPPPPRCSNSDLKVKVSTQHCFWQGTSSDENPTRAVSPRFIFSEGAEASFRDNKMQCVCDLLFRSRWDLENYLIQVCSEPQNHSVCINTSSGSFVSVIFLSLPWHLCWNFLEDLLGKL